MGIDAIRGFRQAGTCCSTSSTCSRPAKSTAPLATSGGAACARVRSQSGCPHSADQAIERAGDFCHIRKRRRQRRAISSCPVRDHQPRLQLRQRTARRLQAVHEFASTPAAPRLRRCCSGPTAPRDAVPGRAPSGSSLGSCRVAAYTLAASAIEWRHAARSSCRVVMVIVVRNPGPARVPLNRDPARRVQTASSYRKSLMKFLVTGAAGFIGFHVAQRLLERGDEVVGLDNLNDYYDRRR